MRTVADPEVVQSLQDRLGQLHLDTGRRWGTLTPHEMLCHLGARNRVIAIPTIAQGYTGRRQVAAVAKRDASGDNQSS